MAESKSSKDRLRAILAPEAMVKAKPIVKPEVVDQQPTTPRATQSEIDQAIAAAQTRSANRY